MKKYFALLSLVLVLTSCGKTGEGTHTGFITATEKSGIIFDTYVAYVKTDASSTQEDLYCVKNIEVYKQLQEFQKTKTPITISHHTEFFIGFWNCESFTTNGSEIHTLDTIIDKVDKN